MIGTTGATDVFMTLYGPDSPTKRIAQDDDSGPGFNARIVKFLAPGTYFVQVRHYSKQTGTGAYGVKVKAVAHGASKYGPCPSEVAKLWWQ